MKRRHLFAALLACTGCSAILGLADPIPADGSAGSRCSVASSDNEPFACQAAFVCAEGRCRQPCATGNVCPSGERCVQADDFATSARFACVPGSGPSVDGSDGPDGSVDPDGATDGGLVDGTSPTVEVLVETGAGLNVIGAQFAIVVQSNVPRQLVFAADGNVRTCDAVGCANASRALSLTPAAVAASAVAPLNANGGGFVWANADSVNQCLGNFDAGSGNCPPGSAFTGETGITAIGGSGGGHISWLRSEADGGLVLRQPVTNVPTTIGGTYAPAPAAIGYGSSLILLALAGTPHAGPRSSVTPGSIVRPPSVLAGSATARPGIGLLNIPGAGSGDFLFWLDGDTVRRCRLVTNDCQQASAFYTNAGASLAALATRGDSVYFVEAGGDGVSRLRKCFATTTGTCTSPTTIAELGLGNARWLVLDGADAFVSLETRIVRAPLL